MSAAGQRLPYQVCVFLGRRPNPDSPMEILMLKPFGWPTAPLREVVCGAPEVGETLLQAAQRVVYEVTGYQRFLHFFPLDYRFVLDGSFGQRVRWPDLYPANAGPISEECFGAILGMDQPKPKLNTRVYNLAKWTNAQEAHQWVSGLGRKAAMLRFIEQMEMWETANP